MLTDIHKDLSSTNFNSSDWESEWDLEMDVDDWHVCIFILRNKSQKAFPVTTLGSLRTSNVPHTEDLC